MLPLLASAAMGAMAKNGLGASAQAAGQLPPGQDSGLSDMLSSFLDADKDGSVIDDVLDMANRFLR
jgi:hypothetical protein